MNVFLGEPSDAVISYVDKRYYKHTVDAMNIDVSACYKVCEEKSAVIPAEKTSSNLSATIQSIKVGYTGGDLDVPVTGSITGTDTEGYSVRGDVYGDVCGSVRGNVDSIGGSVGTVGRGVYGDVGGGVHGNVTGNVTGNICGDVGTIDNHCGVCGTVYGNVAGSVCGGVYGDVYGVINGWYKPLNSTGYTVLTLNQTSGEDTILKIDVCGTQYYIHAN